MALAGNAARNSSARDAFIADFPAGSFVRYYNGAVPAATAAATGTLIADLTLPATPWDVATAGVAAKNGTWSTTTTVAGTPTYFRIVNAAVTKWSQGTVGTDGTANAIATNGDAYTITAVSITFPG